MKGKYPREKELARERAKNLEMYLSENSVSWFELALIQRELARLAKRYGLTKEFRENGLL